MSKPRMAVFSATGTAKKRTIPAVSKEEICEIVAIQGRDELKLASLAEEFSIPEYFVDAKRLLSVTRPDFVFIGSPAFLHFEQISLCLDAGIPVLCEKPLALNANLANGIRDAVRKANIPFRVAHHLRHQPGIRAIRRFLDNQELGAVKMVSLEWSFWLNEEAPNAKWKLDPETGGASAFYDAGIHAIDMMIHLFPRPSKLVALSGTSRFSTTADNVAVLFSGDSIIEMKASHSIRFPKNAFICEFEAGTITIPQAFSEKSFSEMDITTAKGTSREQFPTVNLYAEEVRDFVGLLAGQPSVGTTLDEAVLGCQILDGIERSRSSGLAVSLGED